MTETQIITNVAEIIVRELGPTGLLILVVGYFAQKAFMRLDQRIKKINDEIGQMIQLSEKKLKLMESQNRHG